MRHNVKLPLARRVANMLKQELENSRWESELPGIRTLCEELGVSRQTMMIAVRYLEREAVVGPMRPGKSRAILLHGRKRKREGKLVDIHRVVILARCYWDDLPSVDKLLVQYLEKGLVSRRYACSFVAHRDLEKKVGAKRLPEVLERHPADLYFVLGGHSACREFMDGLPTPSVYLGGFSQNSKFPSVSFSLLDRCRVALKELTMYKHRRIAFFLPEEMINEDSVDTEFEGLAKKLFSDFGLQCSGYNLPCWSTGGDDLFSTFEKLFEVTPPTAVILANYTMVPAFMSFLIRRGLRYPEDVSIVCLEAHDELMQYRPPVMHMATSPVALVEEVLKVVDELAISPAKCVGRRIKSALKLAGSIGAPKKEVR